MADRICVLSPCRKDYRAEGKTRYKAMTLHPDEFILKLVGEFIAVALTVATAGGYFTLSSRSSGPVIETIEAVAQIEATRRRNLIGLDAYSRGRGPGAPAVHH
jgi:hypothetical protein